MQVVELPWDHCERDYKGVSDEFLAWYLAQVGTHSNTVSTFQESNRIKQRKPYLLSYLFVYIISNIIVNAYTYILTSNQREIPNYLHLLMCTTFLSLLPSTSGSSTFITYIFS